MKKFLLMLSICFMFALSSCTTVDEVYDETPSYTVVVYSGQPYYYYYGRYYSYPPRYYHNRPHRPRPNCSGVPAPKPPHRHDATKPSRPHGNGHATTPNRPHNHGSRPSGGASGRPSNPRR